MLIVRSVREMKRQAIESAKGRSVWTPCLAHCRHPAPALPSFLPLLITAIPSISTASLHTTPDRFLVTSSTFFNAHPPQLDARGEFLHILRPLFAQRSARRASRPRHPEMPAV